MSTLELKELSHPAGEVIKIAAGKTLDLKSQGSVTMPTGSVLQVVNFQTGAYSAASGTLPHDDTVPQNTEGTEFMSIAITPTSAASKLKIEVNIRGSMSGGSYMVSALFQDAIASSLAASLSDINGNNFPTFVAFTYYMTAGTTSETTFKVRAGPDSTGTIYINGAGGSRRFGGVSSSSITITEIAQ